MWNECFGNSFSVVEIHGNSWYFMECFGNSWKISKFTDFHGFEIHGTLLELMETHGR